MTEAKRYASKRVSSTDYPVYNDEYELELAFEEGAKWQKNHVWHKSDEKPDEHKLILETDGKGAFWLHATNYMPLDENTRWAYVEDLFLQTTAHF